MMLTWRSGGAGRARAGIGRASRARAGQAGEPAEICVQRYNYLPARFRCHGVLYQIQQVERVWEQRRGGGRRWFAVRCADGRRCTLEHDLGANLWNARFELR